MDEELKLEREFPCGEKIGKSWTFRPQWNLWESVYDEDVSVDVPAGKHRIRLENDGKDWMRVGRYAFTGCKVLDRPNLLVCALRARGTGTQPPVAIVWIQNRESDWFNHGRGEVAPVAPSRVALEGFADGADHPRRGARAYLEVGQARGQRVRGAAGWLGERRR